MQHFVRANIRLQPGQTINSRFPSAAPHPYLLQTNVSNADPHEVPSQERVDKVRSMVQETKTVAEKVTTCIANAAGKPASLLELSGEPAPETASEVSGAGMGLTEVQGASDDSTSPLIHTDPALDACAGRSPGDQCSYTMPSIPGHPLTGACKWPQQAVNEVPQLLQTNSKEASGEDSVPPHGLRCTYVPAPEPETPSECKEVVMELEHQFSVSYVSLTRIIEEYEVVVHSTVCEETVVEEYTRESSAIQEDANKACSLVQMTISQLQKFKFEYQASSKTEFDMEITIKNLIKQCGSLTATQTYLGDVKDTLGALGKCPGLGDVKFQLPTWTGAWARFDQDRSQDPSATDSQMRAMCSSHFGAGARPAEVGEIDSQGIEGMPLTNTADLPVLAACPNCKGDYTPGLTATGYGRVCWDSGSPFTREGQRRNCGGGPRSILCVFEQGSAYSSSSSSSSSSSDSSYSQGSSSSYSPGSSSSYSPGYSSSNSPGSSSPYSSFR